MKISNFSCLSQSQTPLVDCLKSLSQQPDAAFYAPGHKKGQGIASNLTDILGNSVFKVDLPELPQLDNLFAPEGVIKEAQHLAAELFGAQQTWFLINGSTCGIIAAILATCKTGDKIILPRNIHQSAIAGLILSGAIPIFINPEYDSQQDLAYSITSVSLKQTLQQHPDTKAVMVLYPTYQGVGGDLAAIAQITHQYDIPLLVDEAHGAHFAFHPDLPPSALSLGADLTVQSTHKVLSAMTQASMLHLQGNRIAPSRISQALQLLQSTSPNYILLASLDAARQQMALSGDRLMNQTLELAAIARKQLSAIPGISCLELIPSPGFSYLDPTRLTVNVTQLGLTGYEADEILDQQLGVTAELPLLKHLTFIISLGNTTEDINQLVNAFKTLSLSPSPFIHFSPTPLFSLAPLSLSPREAFFATSETIAIKKSSGRICAELICPYPPGIPILMPGEIITSEAIDYLQTVLTLGGKISGCSDPNLTTIQVIN
ncbi:arginine decarboxylase [Stanieria cyanosphaera PCC 7437]|uniref:Arginine decarboxylase n=1 Tax=Stanieria cyanosphaera (strain ATCC 29371 / PCC 7437) TaxID=111780 RepID=K9XQZ5_STAC7|nr:aminotransferase class I/II-fold pyridoxal phosphate-dependent enzyme [Stanieria cyanosphaera]AFZ34486.1 arginine decarboxylase [Stanieria cyanosphaera PCC 7437]